MIFMGKLFDKLRTLSTTNPNELNLADQTLIDVLNILDTNTEAICRLKGTPVKKSTDFMNFIKPLLDCETVSKRNPQSWRIVIDFAQVNGTYTQEPIIQICSGAPSYHRYIMKFGEQGVESYVETATVVKEPDLSVLRSKGSENPQTLEQLKELYDSAQIQRIAILGSARVYAHPDLGQKNPSNDNLWGQKYTGRVERELNKVLNVMAHEKTQYTTVNGGWAGVTENSTGVPLISSLVSAISDAEQGYSLPPITIMPEVGAFDRVVTRSDAYRLHPVSYHTGDVAPLGIDTYFEVPGCWGDDSKFLVCFSTGMIVFEPYGFWTNIEIANGVAQGKPVAIIVDPENIKSDGKYFEQMGHGERFVEIKIPLPGGSEGSYRLYMDGGEAAQWIHDQSAANLMMKKQETMSSSSERGDEVSTDSPLAAVVSDGHQSDGSVGPSDDSGSVASDDLAERHEQRD